MALENARDCVKRAGCRLQMSKPTFQSEAPSGPDVTDYDRLQAPLYIRLLDADAAGASWGSIAEHLFKLDVTADPERARRMVETHVARARWMMDQGYKGLLRRRPKAH